MASVCGKGGLSVEKWLETKNKLHPLSYLQWIQRTEHISVVGHKIS